MKFFILVIAFLIAVAQSQIFAGPGARRLGARIPLGPIAGGPAIIGARVVPVAPVIAAPPVVAAPILPVGPMIGMAGRIGMGGRVGLGFGMPVAAVAPVPIVAVPRPVVVARPRVILGRSVPEDFKMTYFLTSKQLELTFGQQKISCEIETIKNMELVAGVYSSTQFDSSHLVFVSNNNDEKPKRLLIFRDENSIKNRGIVVKSEVCFDSMFDAIKNELNATKLELTVE